MKLSRQQMALLLELESGHKPIAPYYPPARKLVEFGLAKWDDGKLQITYEGLDLLSKTSAPAGKEKE